VAVTHSRLGEKTKSPSNEPQIGRESVDEAAIPFLEKQTREREGI